MSDPTRRSAPLIAILTVLAGFALFAAVLYLVYLPRQSGPFTEDGIHTAAQREKNLAELHAKQAQQAENYAWVDQKAGTIQLPLDVAMKLTVEKFTVRK